MGAGAPVGPRPLDDLEVPVHARERAHSFALGAPMGPRPLEDIEVPVLCSPSARPFVPGVPFRPRPLKDLEVPVFRRALAEADLKSPQPRDL